MTRSKLSDAVLAQYLAPGPQRKVAEIFMQQSESESAEGAIKVRHILYSPNGDPSAAAEVAESDPAWSEAELKARATYDKLKADPSQFDTLARAESDEEQAVTSGGKLPYFSPEDADRRGVRGRDLRSRASSPASSWSRSSRRSAGTSSR